MSAVAKTVPAAPRCVVACTEAGGGVGSPTTGEALEALS